ncbi:MAG: ACP S-malonyltransferase [Rhodospirillales bacterium]|nr:ACP S-malonyltransferase [Alphaproteobacteria bacterium]USO04419.1 MAG: ACP S-malonyltransferase [Rhodospirillales bacterium]
MNRSFVFPGQGSQFVGMGKDLAESFGAAKETFQEVDDALGQNLSALMFDGPEEDLNLTENTQAALMAVSMAVVNVLTREGGIEMDKAVKFVAGHSLGEYSALTAAGALELSQTAKLLKLRGQAMQRAVPVGAGSMAAILGLDLPDVQTIAEKASAQAGPDLICESANDNSVGQVVVSGHAAAVQVAVDMASEAGAKRAVILPVSAPFHCALMGPAAREMEEALAGAEIKSPCVPVVANVVARGVTDPEDIRRLLVEQITGMVRWRESVIWMKDQGVTEMIELGAGKVLSGLARRIDKDIETSSVGTPEQVKELIKKLK